MTEENKFAYHQHLADIAMADVDLVIAKDRSYGASWKKRGGTGAFMMLARKWDRLEELVGIGYDIFNGIANWQNWQKLDAGSSLIKQGDDGTVLAEIRDLRRYLLLVEAEMVERGAVEKPFHSPSVKEAEDIVKSWAAPVPIEDSNRHADRSTLRHHINAVEFSELPIEDRKQYDISTAMGQGYVLRGSGRN